MTSLPTPEIVHLRDVQPRAPIFTVWERYRHGPAHWAVECLAEAMGTFFYTYAGVGPTAAFVCGGILGVEGLSSVFQIGFAYAMGVIFAIVLCAPTSGGHFSPCVTIAMVIFRGFPKLKAMRYIAAQILGGYIACLICYVSYYDYIHLATEALRAEGLYETHMFTPQGPAGILALYAPPGVHIGRIFLNEFVTDTMLSMVIWGCLDSSNLFVPPAALPPIIAFAYAVAVWGYSTPGIATNAARDVGGRLAAVTIYGMDASGGAYGALAALTNIPAMLFGVTLYELFLTDSDRVVPRARQEAIQVHMHHGRAVVAQPITQHGHLHQGDERSISEASHDKGGISTREMA